MAFNNSCKTLNNLQVVHDFSYHLTGCPLESFQEAVPKDYKKVFMANDLLKKDFNIGLHHLKWHANLCYVFIITIIIS